MLPLSRRLRASRAALSVARPQVRDAGRLLAGALALGVKALAVGHQDHARRIAVVDALREVTPPFIREALLASVDAVSSYPRATGLPELRQAIAGWIDRRFDVDVDPDSEVVPTLGV